MTAKSKNSVLKKLSESANGKTFEQADTIARQIQEIDRQIQDNPVLINAIGGQLRSLQDKIGGSSFIQQIPLNKIEVSGYRYFNPDTDEDKALIEDVRERGILEPIWVQPMGDRYRVLPGGGDRRVRSAEFAGLESIEAIIVGEMGIDEAIARALARERFLKKFNLMERLLAISAAVCFKHQISLDNFSKAILDLESRRKAKEDSPTLTSESEIDLDAIAQSIKSIGGITWGSFYNQVRLIRRMPKEVYASVEQKEIGGEIAQKLCSERRGLIEGDRGERSSLTDTGRKAYEYALEEDPTVKKFEAYLDRLVPKPNKLTSSQAISAQLKQVGRSLSQNLKKATPDTLKVTKSYLSLTPRVAQVRDASSLDAIAAHLEAIEEIVERGTVKAIVKPN